MNQRQIHEIAAVVVAADEYTRLLETRNIDLAEVRPRVERATPESSTDLVDSLTAGLIAGLLKYRAALIDTTTQAPVVDVRAAVMSSARRSDDTSNSAPRSALTLSSDPADEDPLMVELGDALALRVAVAVDAAEGMSRELDEDYEGLFGLPLHLRAGVPGISDDDVMDLAHAVLLALQQTGVVAVDPGTFETWPDQTDYPAEIIRQWRALGHDPNLPDIAWLERPDPRPEA